MAEPGAGPEGGAVVGRGTAVLLTFGSGASVGLALPVSLPLLPPLVELPPSVELPPPPDTVLLPLPLPLLVWFTAEEESALDSETVWLPPPWFWLLPADTDAEAEGWTDAEGEGLLETETDDMVTGTVKRKVAGDKSPKEELSPRERKRERGDTRVAGCDCWKAKKPVADACNAETSAGTGGCLVAGWARRAPDAARWAGNRIHTGGDTASLQ